SAYEDDEKAVSWSADHFTDFIVKLMSMDKTKNFDFVAHSMGNRILMELATRLRNGNMRLGRALVFAAPDVATEEFAQKVLSDHFETLYASESDRALQISTSFLHKTWRAGGAGDSGILIVAGVESIDAILRGHSYVYEDPRALRDLGRLLNTQEPASIRGLT